MCVGVAVAYSEVPLVMKDKHDLTRRLHDRGGEKEVRFLWRAVPALLPVWFNGAVHVVRWGNRDRAERRLPTTGWTWRETVEAGRWAGLSPEPVDIPASYGCMNGVWFRVKQGMQGLLVRTQQGEPVVFMVCEPATRYYRVMTRSEWMPCLVGEVI